MRMEEERYPSLPWQGWKIVKRLGRGGYGAVYQAERISAAGKEVAAVKVLSFPRNEEDIEADFTDGYDLVSIKKKYKDILVKYANEYRIMLAFKGQTNIVSCEDFEVKAHEDGIGWDVYIRMELLTPLTARIKQYGESIPEEEVIKVGKDICSALMLCESKHIVHRDIKPENILISNFGDYKLGDFGIAKSMDHATQATTIGSERYMAPEVIKQEDYGKEVDIYSLGLVLYWILNNRKRPFIDADYLPSQDEINEAQAKRVKGEKLPPPKYGSEALKKIVLKAAASAPQDRYSSAWEMYQALDELSGGPGVPKPEPPEDPPTPKKHMPPRKPGSEEDKPLILPNGWSSVNGKGVGGFSPENDSGKDDDDPKDVTHYDGWNKKKEGKAEERPVRGGEDNSPKSTVLEGDYPDEKYLKTIRILLNICTVVMGLCTFGIALLWCIPIRKKILNRIDRREPISSGLKIAALFVGTIPGLLLIVNEDI